MGYMNGTYNLTKLANSSSVLELVETANEATGNILFGLLMIAVFFIIMLAFKDADFGDKLLGASWLCFILSALLRLAGLINTMFVLAFLVMAGLMAFLKVVAQRRG